MPRIDRHAIGADRVVVSAMLEAFLATLVTVRAQALQLAVPELDWIAAVRLDVIGDAGGDDSSIGQAHRAQRLALQLTACSTMPQCFIMQSATIGLVLDVDQKLDGMLD